MARRTAEPEALDEPETASSTAKRVPQYDVLKRQMPTRGSDGKLYRNKNFSLVGAAWVTEKPDDETGEMITYIGVKPHQKFEVDEEGLLLRTR